MAFGGGGNTGKIEVGLGNQIVFGALCGKFGFNGGGGILGIGD